MFIVIREEQKSDYRKVEELTREAFWNLYMPGADEHFILHKLRKSSDFIKKLCLVAVHDDQIVGNIAYSLSVIRDKNNKDHEVVTFGPLSVLPSMQGKGIGTTLVKESIKLATNLGYRAIVLQGYPNYYKNFKFENCKKFEICAFDGVYPKALQVLELYKGALDGISGKFYESTVFNTDQKEYEEYDKSFSFKEKFETESQKAFNIMCSLCSDDPDPLNIDILCNSKKRIDESSIDDILLNAKTRSISKDEDRLKKNEELKLGYTILYVENVKETVNFYQKAFGLKVKFLHESGVYAEMETGATTLAVAAEDFAVSNGITFSPNRVNRLPAGFEVGLITNDVHRAFEVAVKEGAKEIIAPVKKPWGQIVSYVTDNNGILFEICSAVNNETQ